MKKIALKYYFVFFVSMAGIVSCGKIDLYEKQAQIPSQEWFYEDIPEFTFQITDTGALYNIFLVLRHTDLYEYNNIWVRIGSKAPQDTGTFQNLNIRLVDGAAWKGTGMDDIYEVRELVSPGPVAFSRPGDYTFSIAQIMREDPLRYILNVGLRIEKVPQ